MHPFGFDGIQPRAFDRKKANQDAYSLATGLHPLIVLTNPSTHVFAHRPGGIIPDEDQHALAALGHLLANPIQELGRDATDGPFLHETQQQGVG